MSIQALAWAIEQPIPGVAKLVLIALSNHANHVNGYVHFEGSIISREAFVPERSLWRYIGALERNGYLRKDVRKRHGTEQREYWLAIDHQAQEWQWAAQDDDDAAEASTAPSGPEGAPAFRRSEQDAERGVPTATESPERLLPIIEGSKEFDAWQRHFREHRRIAPFVRNIIVEGKELRGYFMPTALPPIIEALDA